MPQDPIPVALTVGGSDPSSGAGIQSDLRTFAALHVYGISVPAALTVQNSVEVLDVMPVPAAFVASQLAAIVSDIPPAAMKTGMLAVGSVIEAVANAIRTYKISNVVVDPVLKSTSGASLLDPAALDILRQKLLPMATVVTPNLAEASLISGRSVGNLREMEEAAQCIHGLGVRYVLVKGGHLEDADAIDVLFDGTRFEHLRAARIAGLAVHGTGCVLSAAIAAYLANGLPVEAAVASSKGFVTAAIRKALRLGRGSPLPMFE